MKNSLQRTFTVFRIIPNLRPANAEGDILCTGEIIIKSGFNSYDEAEEFITSVPESKLRNANLYEIRSVYWKAKQSEDGCI